MGHSMACGSPLAVERLKRLEKKEKTVFAGVIMIYAENTRESMKKSMANIRCNGKGLNVFPP